MVFVKPKFPECVDCRFFRPQSVSRRCVECASGEDFEEKVDDHRPEDNELMAMYASMDHVEED